MGSGFSWPLGAWATALGGMPTSTGNIGREHCCFVRSFGSLLTARGSACQTPTSGAIFIYYLPVLSEISLETARGIRVSSCSATRRVAAPRRKLHCVRAPASLEEIPRLDPAALGKYNVLQAIYSVLRSNAKQEKPTDCRHIHLERDDWSHLCSEEFRGTVSNPRAFFPLVESFDSNFAHCYGHAAMQWIQQIVYQSADELTRLGTWLGQENFNMCRRGCRPKILRPKLIYYDQINVVHPTIPRTKIVLKYNLSTSMVRITTSYHRAGPLVRNQVHNYLPHGPGCVEVTQELTLHTSLEPAIDEYTDEVLLSEMVKIDNATYQATSLVGLNCQLDLVFGNGPDTLFLPRSQLIEKVKKALSF